MPTAIISDRAVQRLRQGNLWIYASDVLRVIEAAAAPVVAMQDEAGNPHGYAFYSNASQIVLRWVAPPGPAPDVSFWRKRLEAAAAYRRDVVADTDAYRLVHGEGDLLPSLVVDRYGDHLVLQTLSRGTDALKAVWVELLRELYDPAVIVERNDGAVRRYENLPATKAVLWARDAAVPMLSAGGLPAVPAPMDADATDVGTLEVPITMNGVRLRVDLLGGQKTGAFLDQRENYAAAARYAHGRALDAFTYAGGFALHLAPHVDSVRAVDISEDACALARRNAAYAGVTNMEVVCANVFDYLHALDRDGEKFDTVVLDPPAFAKNKASIQGAYRGYKEINLRALRLLRPGGVLITCSCSYHMSKELFLQMLGEASADAGRNVRIAEIRGQARDHPALLGVSETSYLKCVIAQVLA